MPATLFAKPELRRFDSNATALVGPSVNAIAAFAPAAAEVNVTVAGNDLFGAAGANAITAFDATVEYSGNIGTLLLNNAGGAIFADVEAASVTLGAGAVLHLARP